MKRWMMVVISMGVIIGAIAGLSAVTYLVSYLAETHLGEGIGRLTNIIFLILVFVMVIATLLTVAERKWSAMMQDRVGPNRAWLDIPGLRRKSFGGLTHLLADVPKMLFKEDLVPAKV